MFSSFFGGKRETARNISKPACIHPSRFDGKERSYCRNCGIILHEDGVKAFKTQRFEATLDVDPAKILSEYNKNCALATRRSRQDRNGIIDHEQILKTLKYCGKYLGLTRHDVILGLRYTDFLELSGATRLELLAACALFLATKSATDPWTRISDIQRALSFRFSARLIEQCELNICDQMNWKVSHVTLLDLVEIWLYLGVVFNTDFESEDSDDGSQPRQQHGSVVQSTAGTGNECDLMRSFASGEGEAKPKLYETQTMAADEENSMAFFFRDSRNSAKIVEKRAREAAEKLETTATLLIDMVIEDFSFMRFDMSSAACAIIAFLRTCIGLKSPWNVQLINMTGKSFAEFELMYEFLSVKYATFQYEVAATTTMAGTGPQSGQGETQRALQPDEGDGTETIVFLPNAQEVVTCKGQKPLAYVPAYQAPTPLSLPPVPVYQPPMHASGFDDENIPPPALQSERMAFSIVFESKAQPSWRETEDLYVNYGLKSSRAVNMKTYCNELRESQMQMPFWDTARDTPALGTERSDFDSLS